VGYYGGRGDFYRGQGDPGIFDFIKAVGKTVIGAVTGGPVGAVAGAAQGFGSLTSRRAREAVVSAGPSSTALTPQLIARHRAVVARGRGVGQRTPAGIGIMAPGGGLRGAHLGRHRRMNVANVKALHRAVRRLVGFEHLYAKIWKSLHKLATKGPGRHRGGRARAPQALVPMHRRLGRGDGLGFVGDFYQGDS
jgi:hypothetical protein